jgi:hypothetical protein
MHVDMISNVMIWVQFYFIFQSFDLVKPKDFVKSKSNSWKKGNGKRWKKNKPIEGIKL